MKTVRCQNVVMGAKNNKCGRILHILTDFQIDMLRMDPEGGIIGRCPKCTPEKKWSRITMNKSGKLIFTVIDPPEVFPEDMQFDECNVYVQIG